MKFLASFWAVVAESPDMRAQMSQQHKIGLLQYCKKEFARLRRASSPAKYCLEVLPTNPFELQESHPEMWQHCLPQPPMPCQVSLSGVATFDVTYACRDRKRAFPVDAGVPRGGDDMRFLLGRLMDAIAPAGGRSSIAGVPPCF